MLFNRSLLFIVCVAEYMCQSQSLNLSLHPLPTSDSNQKFVFYVCESVFVLQVSVSSLVPFFF